MSPLPADLGEGATLRRLEMSDLEDVWAAVEASRERLEPWMPWASGARTIDDQRRWLDSVVHDENSLEGGGLFVDGTYVGGVGLTWDQARIKGEIGYWITAEFEGRGIVTRAVRALLGLGFAEIGLHRIEIRAGVDNTRSRAVAERLGFTRESVARGAGRGAHGFYDQVVYSILEDEWQDR